MSNFFDLISRFHSKHNQNRISTQDAFCAVIEINYSDWKYQDLEQECPKSPNFEHFILSWIFQTDRETILKRIFKITLKIMSELPLFWRGFRTKQKTNPANCKASTDHIDQNTIIYQVERCLETWKLGNWTRRGIFFFIFRFFGNRRVASAKKKVWTYAERKHR